MRSALQRPRVVRKYAVEISEYDLTRRLVDDRGRALRRVSRASLIGVIYIIRVVKLLYYGDELAVP